MHSLQSQCCHQCRGKYVIARRGRKCFATKSILSNRATVNRLPVLPPHRLSRSDVENPHSQVINIELSAQIGGGAGSNWYVAIYNWTPGDEEGFERVGDLSLAGELNINRQQTSTLSLVMRTYLNSVLL